MLCFIFSCLISLRFILDIVYWPAFDSFSFFVQSAIKPIRWILPAQYHIVTSWYFHLSFAFTVCIPCCSSSSVHTCQYFPLEPSSQLQSSWVIIQTSGPFPYLFLLMIYLLNMGLVFLFLCVSSDFLLYAKHCVQIEVRNIYLVLAGRTCSFGWADDGGLSQSDMWLGSAAELGSWARVSLPWVHMVWRWGHSFAFRRAWDLSTSQTLWIFVLYWPVTSFPNCGRSLSALQLACQLFELLGHSLCSLDLFLTFCTGGDLFLHQYTALSLWRPLQEYLGNEETHLSSPALIPALGIHFVHYICPCLFTFIPSTFFSVC